MGIMHKYYKQAKDLDIKVRQCQDTEEANKYLKELKLLTALMINKMPKKIINTKREHIKKGMGHVVKYI